MEILKLGFYNALIQNVEGKHVYTYSQIKELANEDPEFIKVFQALQMKRAMQFRKIEPEGKRARITLRNGEIKYLTHEELRNVDLAFVVHPNQYEKTLNMIEREIKKEEEFQKDMKELKRFYKNKWLREDALGSIGEFNETFYQEYIRDRDFEKAFTGKAINGVGFNEQWLVDVATFLRENTFENFLLENDLIRAFILLTNYAVIEEVIHAVTGISHEMVSGEKFNEILNEVLKEK